MQTSHPTDGPKGFVTALLFTVLGSITPAKADLQDDVARLLTLKGTRLAYHLGPRILEQGEELPLLVPPKVLTDPANLCTHLVVIGAQSIHFNCEMATAAGDDAKDGSLASRAGLVELSRCGAERADLSDLVVTMASLRGTIEVIAVSTSAGDKLTPTVLPNRNVGSETSERNVRRASELPHLEPWVQRLESKAALQGATRTERRVLPIEDKVLGETLLGFDPGCHETRLLLDVDWGYLDIPDDTTELTWEDNDSVAARGTLHNRSPALFACTAVPRVAKLHFPALPHSVAGALFRAHYRWPGGVPAHWALPVRNRIAQALTQRQMTALKSAPTRSWMGGATEVTLSVPVMRRNCYVAIVAAVDEVAGDIFMSVSSSIRGVADSSMDGAVASAAFCQFENETVTISIDARESNATWIAGLWNVTELRPSPDLQ
jgi:hypothetical protein